MTITPIGNRLNPGWRIGTDDDWVIVMASDPPIHGGEEPAATAAWWKQVNEQRAARAQERAMEEAKAAKRGKRMEDAA